MATAEAGQFTLLPCPTWQKVWKMKLQGLKNLACLHNIPNEGTDVEIRARICQILPLPTKTELQSLSSPVLCAVAQRLKINLSGNETVAVLKSMVGKVLPRKKRAAKKKSACKKVPKKAAAAVGEAVQVDAVQVDLVKRSIPSSDLIARQTAHEIQNMRKVLRVVSTTPWLIFEDEFVDLHTFIASLPPLQDLYEHYQRMFKLDGEGRFLSNHWKEADLADDWQDQIRFNAREPQLIGTARISYCTSRFGVSCAAGLVTALQRLQGELLLFREDIKKVVQEKFDKFKSLIQPTLIVTLINREKKVASGDATRLSLSMKVSDQDRSQVFVVLSDKVARKYWDSLHVGCIIQLRTFVVSAMAGCFESRDGDVNLYVSEMRLKEPCTEVGWDPTTMGFSDTRVKSDACKKWGSVWRYAYYRFLKAFTKTDDCSPVGASSVPIDSSTGTSQDIIDTPRSSAIQDEAAIAVVSQGATESVVAADDSIVPRQCSLSAVGVAALPPSNHTVILTRSKGKRKRCENSSDRNELPLSGTSEFSTVQVNPDKQNVGTVNHPPNTASAIKIPTLATAEAINEAACALPVSTGSQGSRARSTPSDTNRGDLYAGYSNDSHGEELLSLYDDKRYSMIDESDDIIVKQQLPADKEPLVSIGTQTVIPTSSFPIRCSGHLCSGIGALYFPRCVTKAFDVMGTEHSSNLAYAFPFKVPSTTGRLKNDTERILRYYYFATEVFGVTGKGKRKELPLCVISKIRETFPNEKGISYVGHKDARL